MADIYKSEAGRQAVLALYRLRRCARMTSSRALRCRSA